MTASERSALAGAIVAVALSLGAGLAHADDAKRPSDSDAALAQSLFDEGVKLMEHGDYGAACPKLAESQHLDPGGGTLLNLGLCREKEGKLASAWVAYNESLSQAIKDRRGDRETTARLRLSAIEGKLAKIVVKVSPGARATAGLEVLLDGTPVRAAAWDTPTPIDRGHHELRATAPGRKPWSTALDVTADGTSVETMVPDLAPADALAPEPKPKGATLSTPTLVGWIAIGVGGASLAAGLVTGILAFERRGRSDDECPNERCTQRGVDLNEQAKTYAWISDVAFGVGLVTAAVGVTLLLTAPKTTAVRLTPTFTATAAGLSATATF